mgnify:CR=1 FL=1
MKRPHILFGHLAAGSLCALCMSQAMACYTVYNPSNQVIYRAAESPIDMSYQIHERLPRVFPAGHMVFALDDNDCTAVNITRARLVDVGLRSSVPPRLARPHRATRA